MKLEDFTDEKAAQLGAALEAASDREKAKYGDDIFEKRALQRLHPRELADKIIDLESSNRALVEALEGVLSWSEDDYDFDAVRSALKAAEGV